MRTAKKKRGGCVICDFCVRVILHVITLANRECAYTITLAINMQTDSNDIYLVSWGSFLPFGFQSISQSQIFVSQGHTDRGAGNSAYSL